MALACCGKSREEKKPSPIVEPPGSDAGSQSSGIFQVTSACALPYRMTVNAPTTWRLPFTNMRPGDRVQLAFWGHWSPATLRSAWFGRFVGEGEVEEAVQVTFDGATSAELAGGVPLLSDPFDYPMRRGERYAVSLSAVGSVPEGLDFEGDGLSAPGDLAHEPVLEGSPDWRVHGLKWVAVEGEAQRVLAVLGDSIGAGQCAQRAEERFIEVAQARLGHPVVDASVGGDGVERALNRLERDVLELPGITDCLVQLGTNDLHREDAAFLIDGLSEAFGRLRAAGIRPWTATIMPKPGHLTDAGEQTRREVNDFLRSTRLVEGYADFDLAVRDPANPANARPGMLADGIHPTTAGHAELADELVRAFRRSR
ncbi:MAG: GDSL-type esterase/lipase family protein [Myxococcales bacterium]